MTHLLKATIAGLVLASPFAVARDYNGADGESGINIKASFKAGSAQDVLTAKGTRAATYGANTTDSNVLANQVRQAALVTGGTVLKESADKMDLYGAAEISFGMDLDNEMSVEAFLEVSGLRNDAVVLGLPAGAAAPATATVEHKIAYAPGVKFFYGPVGIGVKYNVADLDYVLSTATGNTVNVKNHNFYIGLFGRTSLDLGGSDLNEMFLGTEFYTTLNTSAESDVTTFVNALHSGTDVTDTYYNSTHAAITLSVGIANV
ncbi:hypothetical protein MMH89_03695 [Candidatus Comchoanobacter bicostacola]|uniref:Outer membrane protein beta-barrel domain-containing protein n=1 Tax=Candidatus Comchoanobacter bicostacola TaxID=2919598 RepID=A0ABY5DKB5_9GAMM|nr:hypothetical protein [Candidatus Comchoanobacter bicostacola]UTC24324.1 hypothetical protein MMH89_03695 [Candidatus Comchoanobacter bicostacola]